MGEPQALFSARETRQARLERVANEVRSWPAYMRVHSSAYYKAKANSRHDMALDSVGPNRDRSEQSPCPHLPKKDGCLCRHCRGICLCEGNTGKRIPPFPKPTLECECGKTVDFCDDGLCYTSSSRLWRWLRRKT